MIADRFLFRSGQGVLSSRPVILKLAFYHRLQGCPKLPFSYLTTSGVPLTQANSPLFPMIAQTQFVTSRASPSFFSPQTTPPHSILSRPNLIIIPPKLNPYPSRKSGLNMPTCSVSVISDLTSNKTHIESGQTKPFPAEVSRTLMELCSVGTLSTLNRDGWPLGIGVRFAVGDEGGPILCLKACNRELEGDMRSSLHVQLEQCGVRTPQCTVQGFLEKPQDTNILKKLRSVWKKRFGEDVDQDLIHVVSVDRVLQIEDFQEDGEWVSSSDYKNANPDPLRDIAERIVNEINMNNMEDVTRFCNIYVDLHFQVSDAKMIWVDRLGFDVRLQSPQYGTFEARIPFPREVADEKGVKSSFNGMSQLAWEVEKSYYIPDFRKVKHLKQIKSVG